MTTWLLACSLSTGGAVCHRFQRFVSGRDRDHLIAFQAQSSIDGSADREIVVHHQDAHGELSLPRRLRPTRGRRASNLYLAPVLEGATRQRSGVVQSAERRPLEPDVGGSSPPPGAVLLTCANGNRGLRSGRRVEPTLNSEIQRPPFPMSTTSAMGSGSIAPGRSNAPSRSATSRCRSDVACW